MNRALNQGSWFCKKGSERRIQFPRIPSFASSLASCISSCHDRSQHDPSSEAKEADRCWAKGVLGSWQHSSHGGENFWDVSFLHDVITDSLYVSIITGNSHGEHGYKNFLQLPVEICWGGPSRISFQQIIDRHNFWEGDWISAKLCNMIQEAITVQIYMLQLKVSIVASLYW